MTRDSEAELLDFCSRQHRQFDASMWLGFTAVGPAELAATALFLSSVDWFGNQPALRETAQLLLPESDSGFSELAKKTRFDCSRFSNLLRRRLDHARATP